MKKIFLCLLMAIFTVSVFAQSSTGKYIPFPNNGVMGLGTQYHPHLAFSLVDNGLYIKLYLAFSDDYPEFDADSRILIKFEDESVAKLPIIKLESKDFDTRWDSTSNRYVERYITYTRFDIDVDAINAITVDMKKIVKVRIVLTNGDIRDYDLKKKYQRKFIEGLLESYDGAIKKDIARKSNMLDENF